MESDSVLNDKDPWELSKVHRITLHVHQYHLDNICNNVKRNKLSSGLTGRVFRIAEFLTE